MIVAAVIWTVILLDLAALHAVWAMRIWAPLGDETALARAVIGAPGVERMPGPLICGAVSMMLLAAAALPWWDAFGLQRAALFAAAFVFAARGAAAYTPVFARMTPEQPFRQLDRAAYGPLCVALGLLALSFGAAA